MSSRHAKLNEIPNPTGRNVEKLSIAKLKWRTKEFLGIKTCAVIIITLLYDYLYIKKKKNRMHFYKSWLRD